MVRFHPDHPVGGDGGGGDGGGDDDGDGGLETCAARNMDLSGGRQAEARGSAFVAALRNFQ